MLFILTFILNVAAIIFLILARRNIYKLINLYEEYIEELNEALDRSRAIRRMYEEENQRCWKAVQVWETNYEEMKLILKQHKIEIPQ